MTENEKKMEAWDLINEIKTGMLVTKSIDSGINARPMTHVEKDLSDGQLIFFSDDDTLKVYELKTDSNVLLSYADSKKDIYVNVSGKATILKDLNEYLKYWNSDLERWYPQGIRDPKLCLIVVDIDEVEFWDSDINPISKAYKFLIANIKNKRPYIGTHESVSVSKH